MLRHDDSAWGTDALLRALSTHMPIGGVGARTVEAQGDERNRRNSCLR